MDDRIIALVDMDCFYCQVETRLNPSLQGKPLAVVQYNQWQGGGIIAVNYEARAFGVSRHLRGNEAKKKCPEIVLVSVPSVREKADLTKYRDAGREVAAVFCQFTKYVERASIDEAYLDLTEAVEERMREKIRIKSDQLSNTYVVGFSDPESNDEDKRAEGLTSWLYSIYEDDLRDPFEEKLAFGGIIVEEMRAAILAQTGFRCSAGISHNKILAKLACGLHKPNRQTILPKSGLAELYRALPIKKVRNLGGKFGDYVSEVLGCRVMADLEKFTESQLQQHFDEKNGTWLYNIARGIDLEPVTPRLVSKSIGCCKKFPGKQALCTKTDVNRWLLELSTEVIDRLEKDYQQNKRRAKAITVSYKQPNNSNSSSSRCGALSSYDTHTMAKEAYELIKNSNAASPAEDKWVPPITFLGIAAGKFTKEDPSQVKTINSFFKSNEKKFNQEYQNQEKLTESVSTNKISKQIENKSHDNENCNNGKEEIEDSFFKNYFKKRRENILRSECPSTSAEILHCKNHEKCEGDKVSHNICLKQNLLEEVNSAVELPGPSTSYLKHELECNEQWISPREIFPDLDDIDERTVALLPSPMQRKLKLCVGKEAGNSTFKAPASKNSSQDEIVHTHFVDERITHEQKSQKNLRTQGFDFQKETNFKNKCTADNCGELPSCSHHSQISECRNKNISADQVNGIVNNSVSCESGTMNSSSLTEEILKEVCPQCKIEVPLSEYLEHLDFHVAENLQKELNSSSENVNASRQAPDSRTNVGKRKRNKKNGKLQESNSSDKKLRSIKTFFAPLK